MATGVLERTDSGEIVSSPTDKAKLDGLTAGDAITLSFRADKEDSSGVETFQDMVVADLSDLGANVVFKLLGLATSQSGTSTFGLRMGGTPGLADGTLVASFTHNSSTPTLKKSAQSPVSNPGGLQMFKLTITSSAGGQNAEIDGSTLSVRTQL